MWGYFLIGVNLNKVMTQLWKLSNDKCKDLDGLSIKLLKWGVDAIGSILIKVLENASIYVISSTWFIQKVFPIHKSMSKDLVTNYRNIMMGSFFAKLFGKLVQSKLSTWAEFCRRRARFQAGFCPTFNTIGHILVFHIIRRSLRAMEKSCFVSLRKLLRQYLVSFYWKDCKLLEYHQIS